MKEREKRVGWSALVLAAGLAVGVSPAMAQTGGDDEIIVTAQRRAQSVQDVPLSITALGAETIERSGFSELDDYAARVPNLSFSASNSSSTDGALSIAIRGVFGNNTTGFYIDDSPLVGALNPRVVDLERIEALRGPQGTLYGARSMGGTVRLITVQPDLEEFSGRLHALGSSTTDGGFNYGLDGAVNIPLIEGVLGVRGVAYYQDNAGFIDRAPRGDAPTPFPVREDIDSETAQGVQLSALWSLMNGDLTITPRVMHERIERDGRTQADFTADNRVNLRQFDIPEPSESEWTLATLTTNYDAGFGSFLSASSWFDRSFSDTEDFSEWTTVIFGFQGASIATAETDQSIFSQELHRRPAARRPPRARRSRDAAVRSGPRAAQLQPRRRGAGDARRADADQACAQSDGRPGAAGPSLARRHRRRRQGRVPPLSRGRRGDVHARRRRCELHRGAAARQLSARSSSGSGFHSRRSRTCSRNTRLRLRRRLGLVRLKPERLCARRARPRRTDRKLRRAGSRRRKG